MVFGPFFLRPKVQSAEEAMKVMNEMTNIIKFMVNNRSSLAFKVILKFKNFH